MAIQQSVECTGTYPIPGGHVSLNAHIAHTWISVVGDEGAFVVNTSVENEQVSGNTAVVTSKKCTLLDLRKGTHIDNCVLEISLSTEGAHGIGGYKVTGPSTTILLSSNGENPFAAGSVKIG